MSKAPEVDARRSGREDRGIVMRAFSFATCLLVALAGCATSEVAAPARHRRIAGSQETQAASGGEAPAGAVPVAQAGSDDHQIARAALIPALDAGFGRFLGTVRVEGVVEQGRFVGFRFLGFHDVDGRYLGVDLTPGDVVTRVNGSAIERPEQALAVWNALRVNSELCVEYLRNGQRREIRYAIVD